MMFLRYFFCILAGALVSAALGAAFACTVALVSPEFVEVLFRPPAGANLVRYAAAVGMVFGIFLGIAVMGFSLLLTTLVHVGLLIKKSSEDRDGA